MNKIDNHERGGRGVGRRWGYRRVTCDLKVERRIMGVGGHQEEKEDGQGEGKEIKQVYLENVITQISSL